MILPANFEAQFKSIFGDMQMGKQEQNSELEELKKIKPVKDSSEVPANVGSLKPLKG